jgi:hypothetical protein
MASSSHPTVNRIGLSTTPIRSPAKAAATFARPASNASPGTPMGRLTSARRFLWVNLWKNPHIKPRANSRQICRRRTMGFKSTARMNPPSVSRELRSPRKPARSQARAHCLDTTMVHRRLRGALRDTGDTKESTAVVRSSANFLAYTRQYTPDLHSIKRKSIPSLHGRNKHFCGR